jgi:signal transduction histidine kinase
VAVEARSGSVEVLRTAAMTGLPWAIRLRVSNSSSMAAEFAARRRLLGSALSALIVLLAGGCYLLGRVVRRELAVARLQTDFVAAVSHEFRTPLTSLRHITELLQESDDMPVERRRSFYEVLAESSNRLHRLVESLLDFSRMEAERRPWDRRPLEIVALVEDVVADFRRAHPGRLVQFVSSASPTVLADGEAMAHAVWNLLDNAVKYSPHEEPVMVNVQPREGTVVIQVTDRGVGVPADERHDIFKKFVRGARATRMGIKGTGLGLALVSHIVSAHDGRVELESEADQGSTFTIVLPLAPEPQEDVETESLYVSNPHR